MDNKTLTRNQFLAAEIFAYSYANYLNHLGVGNERFDTLMPDSAAKLEQAVNEGWDISRVASELDVDCDTAASLILNTKDAISIVDASTPSAAFRQAIEKLVSKASEEGLDSDDAIATLVTQVCYRVSDLAHLLAANGSALISHCGALRKELEE